jgi:hypothetical protein
MYQIVGFTLDPLGKLAALPQIPLLQFRESPLHAGEGKEGRRRDGRNEE